MIVIQLGCYCQCREEVAEENDRVHFELKVKTQVIFLTCDVKVRVSIDGGELLRARRLQMIRKVRLDVVFCVRSYANFSFLSTLRVVNLKKKLY